MNKSYQWRATCGEQLLKRQNAEPSINTESGILVRSRSEQRIADFLFRKQLTFVYEPVLQLENKIYRPDFCLPNHQLYIEFFGWTHIPSYQQKTQEKIAAYREHQIECIYLYLKGSRYLEDILENQLIEHNVLSPNIEK
jgi:predicted nuclease of restriction endonuclease-like RecB superfamily